MSVESRIETGAPQVAPPETAPSGAATGVPAPAQAVSTVEAPAQTDAARPDEPAPQQGPNGTKLGGPKQGKPGGKPGKGKPGPGKRGPGPTQAEPPVAEVAPTAPLPSGPSAAEVARQVRRERARRLVRALLIWVGLPTLIGIVYYGAIARDEFESNVTLVMAGEGAHAEANAVMLREHILSRDMLARLQREEQMMSHYASPLAGPARLASDARSETQYAYYRRHVDARFDKDSRVFTLRVRSFTGKDAQRFAIAMLRGGAEFVQAASGAQQSPFVVVAKPSAPNEATYPNRIYGVITVFLASLSLFGIGALLIAAVREHAQF